MKRVLWATAITAVAVALLVLTARESSCSSECQFELAVENLEPLGNAGDASAMLALYELNRTKYPNLAMDWALRLAAQGDLRFQRLFYEHFRSQTAAEKQPEDIANYRKILLGPKAGCFLDLLAASQFSDTCAGASGGQVSEGFEPAPASQR